MGCNLLKFPQAYFAKSMHGSAALSRNRASNPGGSCGSFSAVAGDVACATALGKTTKREAPSRARAAATSGSFFIVSEPAVDLYCSPILRPRDCHTFSRNRNTSSSSGQIPLCQNLVLLAYDQNRECARDHSGARGTFSRRNCRCSKLGSDGENTIRFAVQRQGPGVGHCLQSLFHAKAGRTIFLYDSQRAVILGAERFHGIRVE